ncbi:SseB family protein [Actinomadura flavalba]|uniref:SseB family protein n=1 Tax=Actinomadura flavalba TaxID=1120938 RepID=UPI00039EF046|nr:SseB family protein [Actinomadura flavalba]
MILLEWSEFARRLGRELAGLDPDTILIVRERDESRHYVQAIREPDRLYAEAVSNNFLEGPLLLTVADEEVMTEAGWHPPGDPAPRNWWTELSATASPAEHDRLADVMVTALRDVQGVRRPADLVYESFHRHGTGLTELLGFGIDVADPSRVTARRTTAVPHPPPPAAEPAERPAVNGVHRAPAGAGAPLGAPVPDAPPAPASLESLLVDAKQRGDHVAYFELLRGADLVLPGAGGPEEPHGLPLIAIGEGTYIAVFTSPAALAPDGGEPGPFRRTSFSELAARWPDPSWQLAVNPGAPSEVLLDTVAVARLDARQRAAEGVRPGPAPEPPPAPAEVRDAPELRSPHGARLWRWDEENPDGAVPVAVYDAIGGVWAPVRPDVLPGPPAE